MNKLCKNNCISDAHWYCRKCDDSYCFQCAGKKNLKGEKNKSHVHICPQCNRMLKWIGVDMIIEPPLEGVATSFRYPFSRNSMMVIGLLSFFSMLFSSNFLLNEIVFGILLFGLQGYSLSVFNNTITGRENLPKVTWFTLPKQFDFNHVLIVFKHSFAYLLVSSLFFGSFYLESTVLSFFLLAVPACLMPYVLLRGSTAKHVNDYFNYSLFIKILKKNQVYYPVAVFLYIPFISIFYLLTNYSPIFIVPVICYTMIVNHRLMGKMVIRSHSELNYSLDYESFKDRYTLEAQHGFKV